MKALTVQQPWAWAIVHGGKDVENRTQAWSYRGPLAIHAGARWSDRGAHDLNVARSCVRQWPQRPHNIDDFAVGIARHGLEPSIYPRSIARLSAFLGVVDLVDAHACRMIDDESGCCDPWGEQEYTTVRRLGERDGDGHRRPAVVHLVLANPRPLERPIPCAGKLGLWNPPAEVLDELRAAL